MQCNLVIDRESDEDRPGVASPVDRTVRNPVTMRTASTRKLKGVSDTPELTVPRADPCDYRFR